MLEYNSWAMKRTDSIRDETHRQQKNLCILVWDSIIALLLPVEFNSDASSEWNSINIIRTYMELENSCSELVKCMVEVYVQIWILSINIHTRECKQWQAFLICINFRWRDYTRTICIKIYIYIYYIINLESGRKCQRRYLVVRTCPVRTTEKKMWKFQHRSRA